MSVRVHTVTGDIGSEELGFTLPHEHLIKSVKPSDAIEDPDHPELLRASVEPRLAWILRERPYACLDNMNLENADDAADELEEYRRLGGSTLIEVTSAGLGRDRHLLAVLSRRTGVRIIAGGGWYLEKYHPDATAEETIDSLAGRILADFSRSDEPASGVIGEVGISPFFTQREEKSLRAACRAQQRLHIPMYLHLPGFIRRGGRVLDIVLLEEGVDPGAVVMCHMDPSGDDPDYQLGLAERGVWLEFDMIGMAESYPYPGEGRSPDVERTVAAVHALADAGHGRRLLFSHDMFLKTMLRRNGGNGLAYVPAVFLDRLRQDGLDDATVLAVNTTNVQELFETAACGPQVEKGADE